MEINCFLFSARFSPRFTGEKRARYVTCIPMEQARGDFNASDAEFLPLNYDNYDSCGCVYWQLPLPPSSPSASSSRKPGERAVVPSMSTSRGTTSTCRCVYWLLTYAYFLSGSVFVTRTWWTCSRCFGGSGGSVWYLSSSRAQPWTCWRRGRPADWRGRLSGAIVTSCWGRWSSVTHRMWVRGGRGERFGGRVEWRGKRVV